MRKLTNEEAIANLNHIYGIVSPDIQRSLDVAFKALEERPQGDLISREALKEHKFLTPQVKVIGGRHCGKIREQIIEAYQKGWNDCIDAIIDNAPTINPEKKIKTPTCLTDPERYAELLERYKEE